MAKLKITKPLNGSFPDFIKNGLLGIEIDFKVPKTETDNYPVRANAVISACKSAGNAEAVEYYEKLEGSSNNVLFGFPKKSCVVIP